ADELPGRLFGVEPEHFWELIARRRRLELCLGVRQGEEKDTLDDAWVVASDSVLLGELLNGATTLGGTAYTWGDDEEKDGEQPRPAMPRPHPEYLQQTLVWSPGQAQFDRCIAMAQSIYQSFSDAAGDKGLICLGSFSGLATRLLARLLARSGDDFWPPVFSDEGLQIGAYVVRFNLHAQAAEERALGRVEPTGDSQIIQLDRETIARRMQPTEG